LNLYERAGFIKQSIRKNYYPSRNTLAAEDAILMSKSLHTSSTITHVETTLHYAFLHESKLIQAITHKSYVHDVDTHGLHNEVLEFQGDAVLGLIAVDKLLYEHPQANEGILTFLRSAYVSETALAQAIEHHQLASCLRVSPAITHITPSMTADMLEAIIGAVYLDGGLKRSTTCHRCALRSCPS
jgi:ribonuclease-3